MIIDIGPTLEKQAFEEGFKKYPSMAEFPARLTWRPLAQGGAFFLQYEKQPPREHPDAWEFQNTVVKGYKRLAGL